MWYDHPHWWQWLILIAIAVACAFVWWASTGNGPSSDPYRDAQDDGRDIF